MNEREAQTAEELAIELMTSGQSMKNGKSDARRLMHELQRKWLHEAARLMELANYDEDAVSWLDTYADYDPAGEVTRTAPRVPLSTVPTPKPEADFTLTLDPHAGLVSVRNISDAIRNKLRAEGLAEAADIADQMSGSRYIVQELRLRAREAATP